MIDTLKGQLPWLRKQPIEALIGLIDAAAKQIEAAYPEFTLRQAYTSVFIRKKLVELSRSGVAVLLVSADLNEVMELSDSLMVMHNGRIAAYFDDTSGLTDEMMGEYMLGLKEQSEAEVRRVCHD